MVEICENLGIDGIGTLVLYIIGAIFWLLGAFIVAVGFTEEKNNSKGWTLGFFYGLIWPGAILVTLSYKLVIEAISFCFAMGKNEIDEWIQL